MSRRFQTIAGPNVGRAGIFDVSAGRLPSCRPVLLIGKREALAPEPAHGEATVAPPRPARHRRAGRGGVLGSPAGRRPFSLDRWPRRRRGVGGGRPARADQAEAGRSERPASWSSPTNARHCRRHCCRNCVTRPGDSRKRSDAVVAFSSAVSAVRPMRARTAHYSLHDRLPRLERVI